MSLLEHNWVREIKVKAVQKHNLNAESHKIGQEKTHLILRLVYR